MSLLRTLKASLKKHRLKAGFPAFNFIHLYQVKASGFDNLKNHKGVKK
jgi:hypothetical protein